jgi:hypothetical protein
VNTYTFYLHDGPDSIPAFEIDLFESRLAALAFARDLLGDRRRYDRVVVTESRGESGEAVEIARLDRASSRAADTAAPMAAAGPPAA